MEVEEARTGLLTPLRVLLRRLGAVLAVGASALWGTTTVLEKFAIEHMRPPMPQQMEAASAFHVECQECFALREIHSKGDWVRFPRHVKRVTSTPNHGLR